MICERLVGLVKNWYLNVQEETMAPARMVSFMEQHIGQCEVCMEDPDIQAEFEKIRDIVLPASKIPKKQREEESVAEAAVEAAAEESKTDEVDEETAEETEADEVDEGSGDDDVVADEDEEEEI